MAPSRNNIGHRHPGLNPSAPNLILIKMMAKKKTPAVLTFLLSVVPPAGAPSIYIKVGVQNERDDHTYN